MKESNMDDHVTYTYHRIIDFSNKYFPNWRETNPVFYSNAMAGECGEICSITKRLAGGGTNNKEDSLTNLHEELADLFIYMMLLGEVSKLGLKEFFTMVNMKIQKNIERMDSKNEKWYGL